MGEKEGKRVGRKGMEGKKVKDRNDGVQLNKSPLGCDSCSLGDKMDAHTHQAHIFKKFKDPG